MTDDVLSVRHRTTYQYEDSVELAQYMGYLQPLADDYQTVEGFTARNRTQAGAPAP